MERKWIKLAVLVSVCWLITLSAIVGSYRSVENSQLQVEELGYEAPIGAEYKPRDGTDSGLVWLQETRRI